MTNVNLTLDMMRKMCKGKPNESNMKSVYEGLMTFGDKCGLLEPQILPHYLCQLMHESGNFKYDKEIWGPTAAQKRYEGRKDLGNTHKGDGKKFMGRTAMQITGRRNTTKFWQWCLKLGSSLGLDVPNFVEDPDKMNTDPWEGAGPIWYWDEGNPEGKSLNKYAKENNISMITLRINGGKNGLEDRIEYYGRCALVILGYSCNEAGIKKFQTDNPAAGTADGVIGDKTRMALHKALGGSNPFKEVVRVDKPKVVKVSEPVKVKELERPWYTSKDGVTQVITGPVGVTAVGWLTDIPTEKLILLVGLTILGLGGWYLVRRHMQSKQQSAASVIDAEAKAKIATVQADAKTAEVQYQKELAA